MQMFGRAFGTWAFNKGLNGLYLSLTYHDYHVTVIPSIYKSTTWQGVVLQRERGISCIEGGYHYYSTHRSRISIAPPLLDRCSAHTHWWKWRTNLFADWDKLARLGVDRPLATMSSFSWKVRRENGFLRMSDIKSVLLRQPSWPSSII